MEEEHPEDGESEAAKEGTAAHWFLTEQFSTGEIHSVGTLAPNGVPVSAEMVEACEMLRDDLLAMLQQERTGLLLVERKLPASVMVHKDNWGTPDFYLIDETNRVLTVWDYKYGHRYVDAFMNWQMMNYAMLILSAHDVDEWDKWRITLKIAQPRNYSPEGPLRSWYLSGSELNKHALSLRNSARVANEPGAELRSGQHCRDCKAAHVCPALQRAAMSAVDLSYRQTSVDMPPEAVGLELRILDAADKRLSARRDALEAHALGIIARGGNVPGWQRTHVKGRAKWTAPLQSVLSLGNLYGKLLAKPVEAVTPAQAIKLGVDADLVAAYSSAESGAAKLQIADDRSAAKTFGSRQ